MKTFKGIAGSPGIVSGRILYFEKNSGKKQNISIEEAIDKAVLKVRSLHEKALADLGEDKAKIFSAYEMLLEDTMLTDPMKAEAKNGTEPEQAVRSITESMAAVLASKKNEYMRQRADDIRYIGQMLIDILNSSDNEFTFPQGDEKYILAAHELTPVDTMLFDHKRLAGLVTEAGGATSHTVILAKSIGIPALVGVKGLMEEKSSDTAYLDGYGGVLVTEPDEDAKSKYKKMLADEQLLNESLEQIKKSEAFTQDGNRINVCINIGKPSDLKGSETQKFDGVGLFRSEFLYSSSDKKPTGEEQVAAYRQIIESVYPNPVTIRTLDVGGDKQLKYLNMEDEENPFLGNRGIRLCLNNRKIFQEQLESILKAGAGKSVKIMLPMITCIDEIKETRQMIEEIQTTHTDICRKVSLGIMIETPASAVMAETLAKHCDFFSIGTNDLVQYIMAADRGNSEVERLYNPFHPAVIRMIKYVIAAGSREGIEVSVCGDLAANTEFTELLLGMGLKKFSVPLPMVSRIKHKISCISMTDAEKLAEKVLNAEDENEIIKIIRKE